MTAYMALAHLRGAAWPSVEAAQEALRATIAVKRSWHYEMV